MIYGLPSMGHGVSEIFNQQVMANDKVTYILKTIET
jgi:hypothetical protein